MITVSLTTYNKLLILEGAADTAFNVVLEMLVDNHLVNIDHVNVLLLSNHKYVAWVCLNVLNSDGFGDKSVFLRSHNTSAIIRIPKPESIISMQSYQELSTGALE